MNTSKELNHIFAPWPKLPACSIFFTNVNMQLMIFFPFLLLRVKSKTSIDANTRVVNVIGLAGLKQSVCRGLPQGAPPWDWGGHKSVSGWKMTLATHGGMQEGAAGSEKKKRRKKKALHKRLVMALQDTSRTLRLRLPTWSSPSPPGLHISSEQTGGNGHALIACRADAVSSENDSRGWKSRAPRCGDNPAIMVQRRRTNRQALLLLSWFIRHGLGRSGWTVGTSASGFECSNPIWGEHNANEWMND